MSILVILITLSNILALLTLVGTFASWRFAPATAWLSLLLLWGTIPTNTLLFWGITAVIALGINYLLPADVAKSRVGVSYIAGGALTAAIAGTLLSTWGTVIAAAIGAVLGSLAYSRTPSGNILEFPSKKFFNYLCAKGLPITVNISIIVMAATIIIGLYTK
ncbi:MAG: hypothetical protein K2M94_00795 [Paramuribaculum sp.]|nr:hypothetical protein [Paramuribaculum sp.]